MGKNGYVYIMSNPRRTVLYIGVTSNLEKRVYEHVNRLGCGFTRKYNCIHLIYYEVFQDIRPAIEREKELKKYHRKWKFDLIRSVNPELKDLSNEIGWFS